MAANYCDKNLVIWERSNKLGKWIPYSPEVCKYLEENFKKDVPNVCLGNVNEGLKIYSVNFKELFQVSEATGTKLPIRRRLYDSLCALGRGFSWQWLDDDGVFHSYDADVNDYIDTAFLEGKKSVGLLKKFGYPYDINFDKMIQVNKKSKRKRKIQRLENTSSYPVDESSSEEAMDIDQQHVLSDKKVPEILSPEFLAQEIPGTSDLLSQANAYKRHVETYNSNDLKMNDKENEASSKSVKVPEEGKVGQNAHLEQRPSVPETTVALVNGKPWTGHRPPHTPSSELKPVPGIEPLPKYIKPKKKSRGKRSKSIVQTCPEEIETLNALERYTEVVDLSSDISNEMCIICCEKLSGASSYNDDKTLSKLILCSHIFHKACLEAMFISGSKEFLQCPSCKRIHGEKYGIQPLDGEMIYHILPYSLPGYPENDTIRIIYDFHAGIQGPEHPNPGKSYSARGFPRHCYLPDNEMGRKVLRLLIKAWKRRLIFTIGRSSTTGEENTVTWNEIHHKTEFGCNRFGHGYPDPNYFFNVLAELEAHGVIDDEVRVWTPA